MYQFPLHIHFVGCNGIGMSGLAQLLCLQGYKVSGCDLHLGSIGAQRLQTLGCLLYTGHNTTHIADADIVVYSSAVPADTKELKNAQAHGIPVISRGALLGEVMRHYYSIAVSGAHGKTTTTSMIAHMLLNANYDPTIAVGGIVKTISNHVHVGTSKWFVAEADESDRSLLHIRPTIAVVTNIDLEHLHTYRDLTDIIETFDTFLSNQPFYGKLVMCNDDTHSKTLIQKHSHKTLTYGLNQGAMVHGELVSLGAEHSIFNVSSKKQGLAGTIQLNIPGKHNVYNALSALAVCHYLLDIPFEQLKKSLTKYQGVQRRFEYKGTYRNTDIFDDYGHHPTEIDATLETAARRAKNRLHVVFQLHRYSRTQQLWNNFVQVFIKHASHIATLHFTTIYPANELIIPGITAEKLAADIAYECPTLSLYCYQNEQDVIEALPHFIAPGDLLLTLGAGPIHTVGTHLLEQRIQEKKAYNHTLSPF